jgi:endo-1,4-beta-D-glucanase Y
MASPSDAGATNSSASSTSADAGETLDAGDGGTNIGDPQNPPNVLVDDLGIEQATVDTRLRALFDRLFISGNADTELIYYEHGEDEAFVLDVLHDDARMDAMGYGMLLTVQFDEPEMFTRLWNSVQNRFRYAEGPRAGFFRFTCSKDFSECGDAIDSFGSYYVITALLLAAERWSEPSYFDAAVATLAATRDKEVDGAATEGVVNLFNARGVPRQVPLEENMGTVSPVALLPAFFEYWHYRTGDAFWGMAAESSRDLLIEIPHPDTGLTPDVITEAGDAVESPAMYREESYPTAFQLALDAAWFNHRRGTPEAYVVQVNRLLGFFNRQTPGYVALYEIDGTVVEDKTSGALVALNGAAAAIATLPARDAFLQGAWDTTASPGRYRFYDGVYQLLSLMFLGGDLKVKF